MTSQVFCRRAAAGGEMELVKKNQERRNGNGKRRKCKREMKMGIFLFNCMPSLHSATPVLERTSATAERK